MLHSDEINRQTEMDADICRPTVYFESLKLKQTTAMPTRKTH